MGEHNWQWPLIKKSRWVLPGPIYSKRINFGKVVMDFVEIDTNWCKEEEPCGQEQYAHLHCDVPKCHTFLDNLMKDSWNHIKDTLEKSDADWKFVFAHHPIDFLGPWRGVEGTQNNIVALLKSLNVSAWLAGHRHNQDRAWWTSAPG